MKVLGTRNRGLQRLNKVLHKGLIKTIDCISPCFVSLVEDVNGDKFGPWIDLDEIEFIPVTEDALFSMGAERLPDGESLSLKNRLIGYRECRNVYFDKSTGLDLEYVHQLQNLYHLFTGETLV